jgi:hypothetical protein
MPKYDVKRLTYGHHKSKVAEDLSYSARLRLEACRAGLMLAYGSPPGGPWIRIPTTTSEELACAIIKAVVLR